MEKYKMNGEQEEHVNQADENDIKRAEALG